MDIQAFEKAFAEAMPESADALNDKADQKMALFGLDDIAKAAKLAGTFCTTWPKIKGFLEMAIAAIGWMMPTQAAAAKAFIVSFEKTILPFVCPLPK